MAGPRFFKTTPAKGQPISIPGLADGLARLERALMKLTVHNGHIDWRGYEPKIIVDSVQDQLEADGIGGEIVEWNQSVYSETHIRVIGGPVMWSNVRQDDESAYYDVSYSGLSTDDERWLFVEIDLNAGTVTPKFQADATLPVDDPEKMIIRHRLSQWKKTATGVERIATAHAGGAIHFVQASFGPPIGT
jgi:hypothetical protein